MKTAMLRLILALAIVLATVLGSMSTVNASPGRTIEVTIDGVTATGIDYHFSWDKYAVYEYSLLFNGNSTVDNNAAFRISLGRSYSNQLKSYDSPPMILGTNIDTSQSYTIVLTLLGKKGDIIATDSDTWTPSP